jgi:hypothetical protein
VRHREKCLFKRCEAYKASYWKIWEDSVSAMTITAMRSNTPMSIANQRRGSEDFDIDSLSLTSDGLGRPHDVLRLSERDQCVEL